ncbi:MAG: DNA polymerase ligase N-terminal domain-containing protein [Gemmataceae bacterium]
MPRFVILEHDHPELHWDFMLEQGDVLKTWRLFEIPTPGATIPGELSFDHRVKYLDYEGPISGNRGSVVQWDGGIYEGSLPRDVEQSVPIEIEVYGSRVQGLVVLRLRNGGWSVEFPP